MNITLFTLPFLAALCLALKLIKGTHKQVPETEVPVEMIAKVMAKTIKPVDTLHERQPGHCKCMSF